MKTTGRIPMKQLAIEGGKPVRDELLPYGQQWIDDEDIQEVVSVLKSKLITQGPKNFEFEQAVADYAGTKYAVAFANGTAALHGACFAAGVGTGDEVVTTPMTFLASSNCVLYQGGTPVFADIKPDTYNIDPDDVARKINSKTKAIIPVDYTGQPAEMDRIMMLAQDHQLVVIQDAAHSIGAEFSGRKVGSIAHMTMFSFHPVKHITAGEGGIIVTNNQEFYQQLMLFRNHGMTRDPNVMLNNEGLWYYEMQTLGYNYRMTDLQAALGVSQLKKLDSFIQRRREIALQYNEAFQSIKGITIPHQHKEALSSWHIYVLRFQLSCFEIGRKELFDALRAENIGVHVHYIPVHLQPFYQQLGYNRGLCPEAEQIYEEIITLPIFPRMSNSDIYDVIQAVKKVYSRFVLK
jgi:perosamine synthetase